MTDSTQETERRDPMEGGTISLYFTQDMARRGPSFVAVVDGKEIQYTGMVPTRRGETPITFETHQPVWTGAYEAFNHVRTLQKGEFLVEPAQSPAPAGPATPAA